jgi:arginine decarboxylase
MQQSYDELREIWKISDKIVKTTNTTQSSIGKNGVWTTVLAAAVFVPEEQGSVLR